MGFLDTWARACDGKGPDPVCNGRDDVMIAKACWRHSGRIHKSDHLDNVRRNVAQRCGVYLTEEETEDMVQEVNDEFDIGKIPEWDVWNYRED